MARIAGINIPLNKRVEIGLTYVYGIGRSTSNEVLKQAGVSPDTKVKDLTDGDVLKIRERIDELLMEIGSYRGLRHRRGLPVNGQRTKTNARTRKGPKRGSSAGGGKKKVRKH